MNLIVCVDENNGISFNHRRQSKDRLVIRYLKQMLGDQILRCSAYSAELFPDMSLYVGDDYIKAAKTGDWCFVELEDPVVYQHLSERLLLIQWNRLYPADVYCTLSMEEYRLIRENEFVGSSHEKITVKEYLRS